MAPSVDLGVMGLLTVLCRLGGSQLDYWSVHEHVDWFYNNESKHLCSSVSGMEPMSLGSPSSPKPVGGAQFLPGFLMGDLPAPAAPQPRPLSLSVGGAESKVLPLTGLLHVVIIIITTKLLLLSLHCYYNYYNISCRYVRWFSPSAGGSYS